MKYVKELEIYDSDSTSNLIKTYLETHCDRAWSDDMGEEVVKQVLSASKQNLKLSHKTC